MLQPSVIKSATVVSSLSIAIFILVLIHDIPFAIGLGSLPSSLCWFKRPVISLLSLSCSALLSRSRALNSALSTSSITSSIAEIPILMPESHSFRSLTVSPSLPVLSIISQPFNIVFANCTKNIH